MKHTTLVAVLALAALLPGCAATQAHRAERDALGAVIDFALGAAALAGGDVVGAALSFSSGAMTLGGQALEERR